MSTANELYLAVLPMIHLAVHQYGFTEEVLTLLPSKDFATRFSPNEVESFIRIFKNRTEHLTGGSVTSYDFQKIQQSDGRFIVRVVQYVR